VSKNIKISIYVLGLNPPDFISQSGYVWRRRLCKSSKEGKAGISIGLVLIFL